MARWVAAVVLAALLATASQAQACRPSFASLADHHRRVQVWLDGGSIGPRPMEACEDFMRAMTSHRPTHAAPDVTPPPDRVPRFVPRGGPVDQPSPPR